MKKALCNAGRTDEARKFLDQTFPVDSLIYVGRRVLQTATERKFHKANGWTKSDLPTENPNACPHVYLDAAGTKVAPTTANGGTGFVVDEQKLLGPLTEHQVESYRTEMQERYTELVERHDGEPVHVINCRTSGAKIDLTDADKLAFIETEMPDIWDAVFDAMDEDTRLKIVGKIWVQIMAAK